MSGEIDGYIGGWKRVSHAGTVSQETCGGNQKKVIGGGSDSDRDSREIGEGETSGKQKALLNMVGTLIGGPARLLKF